MQGPEPDRRPEPGARAPSDAEEMITDLEPDEHDAAEVKGGIHITKQTDTASVKLLP